MDWVWPTFREVERFQRLDLRTTNNSNIEDLQISYKGAEVYLGEASPTFKSESKENKKRTKK